MAINETANSTLSTAITGAGNFAKTGNGELVMTSTPGYTGETIVSAGTLRLTTYATEAPTGSVLWVDASQLGLADGQAITALTNLSGTGNNLHAPNSADAPTYSAGSLNGMGTIRFSGGEQGLVTDQNIGISDGQSRSIFTVMKRDNGSDTNMIVSMGEEDYYKGYGLMTNDDLTMLPYTWGQGGVQSGPRPAGVFEMYGNTHLHEDLGEGNSRGTHAGYVNGALFGTGSNQNDIITTNRPVQIGYRLPEHDFTAISSNGNLAELLIYDRSLSNAERVAVETYLNHKWMGVGVTSDVLPVASPVTVSAGATLAVDNLPQTIGGLSGGGNVTLNNSTLTVNSTVDTSFSGHILGNGSLVKTGDNKLTISGINSYSGTTTVSGGTLEASPTALPGAVAMENNANLTLTQADGTTGIYSDAISGAGSVTKSGSGLLTLGGDTLSYSGDTIISGGTLRLPTAAPVPTSPVAGSVLWIDASTLNLNPGDAVTSLANLSNSSNNMIAQGNGGTFAIDGQGRKSVYFSGGNDGLKTQNDLGITGDASRTMVAVMSFGTGRLNLQMGAGGTDTAFGISTATDFLEYFQFNHDLRTEYGPSQPNTVGPLRAVNTPETYVMTHDSATTATQAHLNGTYMGTLTGKINTTAAPFTVGLNGWGYADGKINEVLIYDSVLSTDQQEQLNAYLNYKWYGIGTGSNNVLPTTTSVAIAANSTLDINGIQQTVAGISGAGTIALGTGTLTVDGTNDSTFGGKISGSGSLVKAGPSTLALTGATKDFAGTTTVTGGTLQGDTTSMPLAVTVEANAVVKFDQAFDGTSRTVVSGAGSVAKSGDGVLTIASASTYGGETRVSGGTLRMAQTIPTDAPVAGSTLWLDASTLTLNNGDAVATLNDRSGNANNANATNWGGSITYTAAGLNGKGIIHISGTEALQTVNDLNITGDASRSVFVVMGKDTAGRISIQAGKDFGNDFGLDNNSGNLNYFRWNDGPDVGVGLRPDTMEVYGMTHDSANQDTIVYANGAAVGTINSTLHTDNAPVRIGAFTNQGWCSENGSFAEALIYDRVLSDEERTQVEAYLNAKWFGITPAAASLPAATAVTVDAGSALDINSTQQTIGSLAGDGNVTLGTGTLTVASTADSTFAGSISGDGTFVKDGASTLVLSGANSNQGGMVVNNGTLQIDSADALASDGGVVVGENGTVVLSSSIGKAVKIRRLTMLVGSGSSQSGLSATASNSAPVAPVPEPSTIVLLAAGAMALAVAGLRRRNRAGN